MIIKTIHKALVFTILFCSFWILLSIHFLYIPTTFANPENTNNISQNLKIIITELSPFESSNLEWIEIYNPSEESINIQNLKLIENETNHVLSPNNNNSFELEPYNFAIIANKADQLIAQLELSNEENLKIYDSTWSSLNLNGEILELSLNEIILDSINYGASNQNTSLERNQSFSLEDNIEFSHHPESNSFLAPNSNWSIPEDPNPIDCESFPNHEDCQTEPIYCELFNENPPEDCQNLCPVPPDPITITEHIESPVFLISEVSFKDQTQDWIEIYIDPKQTEVDLSQYYLEIDNHQIPLGSENLNSPQLLKYEYNLVGTTEQVLIRDNEQIFDTICWQNSNPSASELIELNNLLSSNDWHNNCLDSEEINNNQSFSRINFFTNTKSAEDWTLSYHSTADEFNYQYNEAPNAKITIQSGEVLATEKTKLNLDGSSSQDPDQDELKYLWTLDEIEFSDKSNPASLDINELGQHAITLTVTDPYEASSKATIYIEINEKQTEVPPSQQIASSNQVEPPTNSSEKKLDINQFKFKDGNIVIHSFLANPHGSDTNQEWIKIQNLDTESINLENWILDDELDGGSKSYTIPKIELTSQEIYSFSNNQTKISLKNTSDVIHLLKPDKTIKDQLSYTDLKEDEIIRKNPDDNTLIRDKDKTPSTTKKSNSISKTKSKSASKKTKKKVNKTYPNGDLNTQIQLTEIFANPKGPDKGKEWVELYNPTDKETNLSNWKIYNNTKEFTIHDTIISSKSYLKIALDDFSLSNTTSYIQLKDFENKLISECQYEKAVEDQSYQLLQETWYWLKTKTPGQANPILITLEGSINSINLETQTLNILDKIETLYQINYNNPKLLEQFNSDSQYQLKLEVLEHENQYELFKILSISKIEEEKKKDMPIIPLGIAGFGLVPAFVYKQQLYKLGIATFQKIIS